jgi:putative FmdB family regulatory protein
MPNYEYACEKGHRTEIFRHMKDKHPSLVKCGSCPRLASRIFAAPVVVDDFPEHFNVSMGTVVKNRAHHKQLQKERGLQDYEVRREGPMTSRLRKEGLL